MKNQINGIRYQIMGRSIIEMIIFPSGRVYLKSVKNRKVLVDPILPFLSHFNEDNDERDDNFENKELNARRP